MGRGTGEIAALWAGGRAVKSVETLRGDEPPRLRLISANHVVGTVPWTVRRM